MIVLSWFAVDQCCQLEDRAYRCSQTRHLCLMSHCLLKSAMYSAMSVLFDYFDRRESFLSVHSDLSMKHECPVWMQPTSGKRDGVAIMENQSMNGRKGTFSIFIAPSEPLQSASGDYSQVPHQIMVLWCMRCSKTPRFLFGKSCPPHPSPMDQIKRRFCKSLLRSGGPTNYYYYYFAVTISFQRLLFYRVWFPFNVSM